MATKPHIETLARGVLTHGEHLLLCRSIEGDYWYLPGGHVDPGETCAQACEREFLEESGLRVTVGPCLLVNELRFKQGKKDRHEITMVFHVEHHSQSAQNPGSPPLLVCEEEHIELAWVPMATLVDLDLRPDCIRAWLSSGGVVSGGVTGAGPASASGTEWLSIDEI